MGDWGHDLFFVLNIPLPHTLERGEVMITYDDKELMIERYKEILKVRRQEIKIRCSHKILTIQGENLLISAMTRDEILIGGAISAVLFDHE